jgi:hypothetical protein
MTLRLRQAAPAMKVAFSVGSARLLGFLGTTP